jgi:hypothetical protein
MPETTINEHGKAVGRESDVYGYPPPGCVDHILFAEAMAPSVKQSAETNLGAGVLLAVRPHHRGDGRA